MRPSLGVVAAGLFTAAVVAGGSKITSGIHMNVDKFNLVGTLSKIASTNGKLSTVNGRLLGTLNNVSSQSVYSVQSNDKLTALEGSLGKQVDRLEQLRLVTEVQVQLGTKLQNLSQDLESTLSSIDTTAAVQHQTMESLRQVAVNLSETFAHIDATNKDANRKLQEAAKLSQQADQEMP